MQLCCYFFFLPLFPDFIGATAGSCFQVIPWCLGTKVMFGKEKRFWFKNESLGVVSNGKKSKCFRGESVWNVSSFYTATVKRQNRCFKWFWFTSFSFPLNLKCYNKQAKWFHKVVLIRLRIISQKKLKHFCFSINLKPYQMHPNSATWCISCFSAMWSCDVSNKKGIQRISDNMHELLYT
jgi:hypothetical protein